MCRVIDDNISLLNELAGQADEAMAAIVADVDQEMPIASDPVWKRLGRARRCKAAESPAGSVLNAPGSTQAPLAECSCRPDDLVPGLKQEPRIDLAAGVVRCATCGNLIGKSCRTKRARRMRRIAELHHHHPLHVDVAGLRAAGWLL